MVKILFICSPYAEFWEIDVCMICHAITVLQTMIFWLVVVYRYWNLWVTQKICFKSAEGLRELCRGFGVKPQKLVFLLYIHDNNIAKNRKEAFINSKVIQYLFCMSVHPSAVHHISGTIHHVIIVFGTHM